MIFLCDLTGRTTEEASDCTFQMGTDVLRLLDAAQSIAQIDLGVAVRRVYDTFKGQVVQLSLIDSWFHAESALESIRLHTLADVPNAWVLTESHRLDHLFLSHSRLWKKPRLSPTSVLTVSRDHKLVCRYIHRVIDAYLLVDSEAGNLLQIFYPPSFHRPSVAPDKVRNYKLIYRLLDIITSFFTTRHREHYLRPLQYNRAPNDLRTCINRS
ncbi:hypothetical protein BT96DRAFT_1021539 [Gymnopus androsaceus JB14]|uniref:Uncharacterized protein n=1 Tax=Gymnopus androsaceus JB14 TaxID=1447944 RepID=A0A6A4HE84_9AGAR|nr:hypothetical protein BT96DRAFT_1021539 [Gymnopus androsaceus JB14]